MKRSEAKAYRNKVIQGEQIEAVGGIKEEFVQSDKIGFDWRNYYVNKILVRSDYVKQENPVGVADNPFEWSPGMKLILNGYYTYNGKRYVAVAEGSPETITEEYLVEF